MLDKVSGLNGAAFDRAWITTEIMGHRETLAAVNTELQDGSSAQVKQVATDAKPVVQEHLKLLEQARGTGATPGSSPSASGRPSSDQTRYDPGRSRREPSAGRSGDPATARPVPVPAGPFTRPGAPVGWPVQLTWAGGAGSSSVNSISGGGQRNSAGEVGEVDHAQREPDQAEGDAPCRRAG